MCGIAGVVGKPFGEELGHIGDQWLRSLRHRGPDDDGWLTSGPGGIQRGRGAIRPGPAALLLLHRRLSILDLSELGWQPMSTPDDRYHITFNGEIYNYNELRRELEDLGHHFRSSSDTEVLLTALAEWGQTVLPRLVGMFAFALLDTQSRTLLLARDPFGIKPLYHLQGPGYVAFASELRPLLELPGVRRQVNPRMLHDYLEHSCTDHGSQTLFQNIQQIPAAHCLELSLDNPTVVDARPYWQIDLDEQLDISFDEAKEQLRERFLRSVGLHLRSDVPVGACLSGGIDSSSIVMAIRHLQGPAHQLHTFSFVADDPLLSEEKWVDLAGKAARCQMHNVRAEPEDLVQELDRLIQIQEVPFASTSIYAQHRVFRLAQEAGIKVILDGQGADELFAGYRYYLGARLGSLVRQRRWSESARLWWKTTRLPNMGIRGGLRQLGWLPQLARWRGRAKRWVRGEAGQPWLNADWFRQRDALNGDLPPNDAADVLRHELCRSLVSTSLPQLLRYEDRNSMAFSIESRVPFLDPTLVKFVLALPEEYFIAPDGTSKWVFREAMRGIVPQSILDRRDKIGFATPESRWLTVLSPWIGDVLSSKSAKEIGALHHPAIHQRWQAIRNRRKPMDAAVWRWVNLIEWARIYDVEFG